MIEGIRLGNVMVDCANEQELQEFYHRLLGWKKQQMFGCPAVKSPEGLVFIFTEEKDYIPPVWPEEKGAQQKQMHFDFQVPDVGEAVKQAEGLGAKIAAVQFGGTEEEFVTLLDPAGHPFCLCAAVNKA